MADQAVLAEHDGPQPSPLPLLLIKRNQTWPNNVTLFIICALWLTLAYLVADGEVTSLGPLPESQADMMFLAAHNRKGSGKRKAGVDCDFLSLATLR